MYYESFDSLKYGKGVERRYRCKYDEQRSRRNEEWERKNIRENERVKKKPVYGYSVNVDIVS